MKTSSLNLNVLATIIACATVFHVGCGDDDDNATPSNGKGGASSAGGASATGGKNSGGATSATGGATTSNGGSSTTSGGAASKGGSANASGGTNAAGSGGETPVMTGGAGGQGTGPGEAGAGGAGGAAPTSLPPCSSGTYDATNKCYAECSANTTTKSEQFLNHCSEAGANCTHFDNSTLTRLGANGALPALP